MLYFLRCMKKLYHNLIAVICIALFVSSCKLDPPIYPQGTSLTPPPAGSNTGGSTGNGGTNNGGNTGGGIGGSTVPVGGTNTVIVQTGSTQKTYNKNLAFSSVVGANGIIAAQSQTDIFMFNYVGDNTGTFDILSLNFSIYSLDPSKGGKVTVISNSMNSALPPKGTIKGTFTINLVDANGKAAGVAYGSFNISQ